MSGRIIFDQVWKRFHRGPAHDSLRDLIPSLVRRLGGAAPSEALGDGDFWAVQDVSFEVQPGQALGIIGGNGAGKSTTLKLLTKILQPTRGRAEVTGRVGSLIEVSAGFHPDLTGRENVFLQGAIMGMPQRLIRERFDEIVEFSGISPFIDTPVKRYSSGMNARLGFSIAAHLEPDVLIIDEVLSVGDAEFQDRAFGRIQHLVKEGIPAIVVSHQMDRIVELCTTAIFLKSGQIVFAGDPRAAVERYLQPAVTPQGGGGPSSKGPVSLDTLSIVGASAVPAGATVRFRLNGKLSEADWPEHHEIHLVVFDTMHQRRAAWMNAADLTDLPRATGGFDLPFRLTASLPTGVYRIEALLWNAFEGKMVGEAPGSMLRVTAPTGAHGTHFLDLQPDSSA